MPQENMERLRRGLDAFNRRDKAAFLAASDPDLEDIPPRDWPESEPTRGREAVWDLYAENTWMWEGAEFEYAEMIDGRNGKIAAQIVAELQGRASGAGVRWDLWQVATHRDGRLLRLEWFTDREQALEAVGLSE
jgi:ketosteroid isomerase-like protein